MRSRYNLVSGFPSAWTVWTTCCWNPQECPIQVGGRKAHLVNHDNMWIGMCVSGIRVYGSPFSLCFTLFPSLSSLSQWTTSPFTLYLSTRMYVRGVPELTSDYVLEE